MAGLTAATFARDGYRGPSQALEGRHGFRQAYAPAPDPGPIVEGIGSEFETMATGIKPYPSCRYGHAGIDAVLELRSELGLDPSEIESVTYGLSNSGLLLVGEPVQTKQNPTNVVGAQFSAPFVLSAALLTGSMGWDSYALLNDPALRSMLPRVHCEHDLEIEAEIPTNMSGKITIRARVTSFTRKVVVPLGEPSNFLSQDALLAKFENLAEPVLGSMWRDLADAALNLDQLSEISALTRCARPVLSGKR